MSADAILIRDTKFCHLCNIDLPCGTIEAAVHHTRGRKHWRKRQDAAREIERMEWCSVCNTRVAPGGYPRWVDGFTHVESRAHQEALVAAAAASTAAAKEEAELLKLFRALNTDKRACVLTVANQLSN